MSTPLLGSNSKAPLDPRSLSTWKLTNNGLLCSVERKNRSSTLLVRGIMVYSNLFPSKYVSSDSIVKVLLPLIFRVMTYSKPFLLTIDGAIAYSKIPNSNASYEIVRCVR